MLHSWICKIYHGTFLKTFNFYTHSCQRGSPVLTQHLDSHSGINSMWILKNLKDLLETLNSRLLSEYNSIKAYDFSTMYTSIPHTQLPRLKNIIHRFFSKKDGTPWYKYIVLGRDSSYFVKNYSNFKMWEFFIDNIFVQCGGRAFQQTVGIWRDDFSFWIVNFPFICGNIPSAPAYGVFISQLKTLCQSLP